MSFLTQRLGELQQVKKKKNLPQFLVLLSLPCPYTVILNGSEYECLEDYAPLRKTSKRPAQTSTRSLTDQDNSIRREREELSCVERMDPGNRAESPRHAGRIAHLASNSKYVNCMHRGKRQCACALQIVKGDARWATRSLRVEVAIGRRRGVDLSGLRDRSTGAAAARK